MSRAHRPCRRRSMVSAMVCFSMLLLRYDGRGVLAQESGDGDEDNSGVNTLPPTGAPALSEDDDSSEYPDCPGYAGHIRDGYCDSDLNIASCGWDGGDCCACTCGQGLDSADEQLPNSCGQEGAGYDCQDPDVPADCGAIDDYPDCDGLVYSFQNSFCNDDLNNAECGWDGGDCCFCTCRDYGYNNCGLYGYDCKDPEVPSDCDEPTPSPTPSPAATSGYPGCEGPLYYIGDGKCDSSTNNEDCEWDGGDCCSCDCQDSNFSCNQFGFNCTDPSSTCNGSESSSFDDDVAEDYGDRDFSSSADSTSVSIQDVLDGSSESSFSDVGMVGVFVLSVAAFILLGCAALAGCAFLRDKENESAAAGAGAAAAGAGAALTAAFPGAGAGIGYAGAAGDGAAPASSERRGPSRPLREAVFYPVPQGPSSPAAAAERAGDWALAAALRRSSSAAATGDIEGRASVDARSAGRFEAGVVGAQTSRRTDQARRGRAFYRVRPGPPSPASAAEAAGDRALAAALRISAATAPTGPVERRASIDEQSNGRFGIGADSPQEGKHADEAELGRAFHSKGDSGVSEARSAEGGGRGAASADGEDSDSEPVWEEERDISTSAVAGAGDDDAGVAAEKEEEHHIEDGAVEEDEGDTSSAAVAGAGIEYEAAVEEKEAGEHDTEDVVVGEDGRGEDTEGGEIEPEQAEKDADDCSAGEAGGMDEETKGEAVENEAGAKEATDASAVEAGGVGEETEVEAVEDQARETETPTTDTPEAKGVVDDKKGSSDLSGAE